MHTRILALLLAAGLARLAAAASDVLVLTPLPEGAAPGVDGALGEPAWQQAPALELADTVLPLRPAPPGSRTTLRLLAGGGILYLGVECLFPPDHPPQGRVREHDAPVFEDESLEVFLAMDGRPCDDGYWHFAVNTQGAATERQGLDPAWRIDWTRAVRVGPDRWTAELAIPLAALSGGEPPAGHYWRLNVCRNLYDASGDFAQGLALERPGYYRPSRTLVAGAVRASVLLAAVTATLAELEGPFTPHLRGAIRQQYDRLRRDRAALAGAPDAEVPPQDAAAMLGPALDHAGSLPDMIIWNYLFD